jgi:hypothetical protein
MKIELSEKEMVEMGLHGLKRCAMSLVAGRRGAHGFDRQDERWQIDVEGVLTEYAAAKALGFPYLPVTDRRDTELGDIAPGIQVRGTKYPSGNLLLHKEDLDDHIFILVTGKYGRYHVRGWLYAREGKRKKFWRGTPANDRPPCFWVPQSHLNPIQSFPGMLGLR